MPTKGRFAGSGRRADDIEPRTEKLKAVEIFKTGTTVGIIFHFVDFRLKMIGEEISEGKFFGRDDGAADLLERQLSFGNNVGGGKLSKVGVLANDFGSDDEFAQVGFLFDYFGVVLGEGGSVGGIDEAEQVHVVDFIVVAVLLQFVFDGEKVDGFAGGIVAHYCFEDELMFGAVKVVGVDNGENLWNDEAFVQEHGGEKLFFHFDVVGEVVVVKHSNHLIESEAKKRRHSRK